MYNAPFVKKAGMKDILQIENVLRDQGVFFDAAYYEQCFAETSDGQRDIFLAYPDRAENEGDAEGDHAAGFVIFNRKPRYALYERLNIPEIQDLNIIPSFRGRGWGRRLVLYCEERAREESYEDIGISVGLHKGFGAAQRLYCTMGYIPDGFGVSYDRYPVTAGEMRPVDDLLCLMMVKSLSVR